MLTITNLKGEDYKAYILNEVVKIDETPNNAADYYAKKDGVSPFPNSFRMEGEAAKAWGIDGDFEANKDIFAKLYDGLDPATGKPLTQNQDKKYKVGDKINGEELKEGDKRIGRIKERRAGLDCTFSAPKSISIALAKALADGDEAKANAILQAHREAVSYAMEEMGKGAITRAGKGGKQKLKGNKLIYAIVDHFDARPVGDNPPDMQLHSHAIQFNMAIGPDGKCRTIEDLSMNQQIKSGGALYRAKLAEGLQKAGLAIKNVREVGEFGATESVTMEVQGVGEEAIKTFSKRQKEVLDVMIEENIPASQMRSKVKEIRSGKGTFSHMDMMEDWKRQMDALPADQFRFNEKLKDELSEIVSDQQILDYAHDFKKKTFLTEYDIKAVIAQVYTGHPDAITKIEETSKRILQGELVANCSKPNGLDEALYCSKKLAVADKLIRDTVKKANSKNSEKHQIKEEIVKAMVDKFQKERGFSPSKEQLEAIQQLTGKESISVLRGLAGSGKTTAAQIIAQSFAASGFRGYGCAMANDAARKLEEETGLKSSSIVKLLGDIERGAVKVDSKTFIYIDEVGMVDLDTTAKLINIQRETGCRMILAGDSSQLSPVGPGSGLRVLEECINPAELKEIRRQKKEKNKELAIQIYGIDSKTVDNIENKEIKERLAAKWIDEMKKEDMVAICETELHAVEEVAQAYVDNPKGEKDKLVIATTNDSVRYLNKKIQSMLVDKGARQAEVLNTVGEYDYREGDKVRFNNTRKLDGGKVINGTQGTVVGQDEQGRLIVETDTKNRVVVPDDFKYMQLNYAITVHKSQGQSIEDVMFYCDGQVNRNMGLVAYTRHSQTFKLYGKEAIVEGLKTSLAQKDLSDGVYQFIRDEDKEAVDRLYQEQYLTKEARAVTQAQDFGLDPLLMTKATEVMKRQLEAQREPPRETQRERIERERKEAREALWAERRATVGVAVDRWSKAPIKEEEKRKRKRNKGYGY
ncbi:MobF family relaxase [Rhodanobacter sp. FW106-PBR-R2A-1-13]|uniref:MobF family relaxase n=1 Tax=Rhodanobacter sp. FW106-PBR-R2A-1-13 TaxID=3454845 RepID=UPI0034E3CD85